jgi:serine/threonine protein kinase
MENKSYELIVEEILWHALLQSNTCQKCRNIVGVTNQTFLGTPYKILHWWFVAEQIIITTFEWRKIIIKIGTKQKLLIDADREIFVWWLIPDVVPSILKKWEGKFPAGNKYWVVQEYRPGENWADYLKNKNLTEQHIDILVKTLWKLHQTKQDWELFFWRAGPWARKKYNTFDSYIGHFQQYIDGSDHFPLEIKQTILEGISYYKEKMSGGAHIPCLIHWDFQERNIIIPDDKHCSLIDFWDAKWSLKEAEFATMLSHMPDHKIRAQFLGIIKAYEIEFWPLNKDLLNLFFLCCGAYKIIQRKEDYTQDMSIWTTIIRPILNQITTKP